MQCAYRETAKKLLFENEGLQNQMAQAERDTVDVITFLKKEDMKKDDQVWFNILALNFENIHPCKFIMNS